MKIAFTGVSSTGKTTLSTEIANRLRLPQIHEPLDEAYDWCRRHHSLETYDCRYFTQQDKVRFERGMFATIDKLEKRYSSFVADSARLLHMMYLLYGCAGYQNTAWTNYMYEWFMRESLKYDYVFYIPFGSAAEPIIPVVDDNRRLTDPHQLQAMDGILQKILEDAKRRGVNVVTLTNRLLDSRIAQVMANVFERNRSERCGCEYRAAYSVIVGKQREFIGQGQNDCPTCYDGWWYTQVARIGKEYGFPYWMFGPEDWFIWEPYRKDGLSPKEAVLEELSYGEACF